MQAALSFGQDIDVTPSQPPDLTVETSATPELSQLKVSFPERVISRVKFDIQVTALDAEGNPVSSDFGSVPLSASRVRLHVPEETLILPLLADNRRVDLLEPPTPLRQLIPRMPRLTQLPLGGIALLLKLRQGGYGAF